MTGTKPELSKEAFDLLDRGCKAGASGIYQATVGICTAITELPESNWPEDKTDTLEFLVLTSMTSLVLAAYLATTVTPEGLDEAMRMIDKMLRERVAEISSTLAIGATKGNA